MMKTKRINLSHRVIAFLLACTMIITMMPYQLVNAEENIKGIGIINHVMTDHTDLQTVYKVTLYQTTVTQTLVLQEEGEEPVYE